MKVNIKEMARKAGVSVATISRAMNSETRDKVASKTLKKVDKLIRKYAYTPNLAAKNLRQSSTKTIGVIFPYLCGIFYISYYNHILAAISDFLLQTDYQFKMLLLKEEKSQWDHYNFKSGERVDGLIVTHWYKFFSKKSVLEEMDIPCVIINDWDKKVKAFFVCGDHFRGGQTVASHLYSLGHRHIAVLTGPSWSRDSQQRFNGFRAFLRQVGVSLDPNLVSRADYLEEKACEKVEKFLERNSKITAIFCCNDQMAYGAIRGLKQMGISCPQDISVVGYDDDSRSESFGPSLTTIRVPIYDLAKEAGRSLVDYLKNKNSKPLVGQTLLPVHLIERKSVRDIRSGS